VTAQEKDSKEDSYTCHMFNDYVDLAHGRAWRL
jgi:hypothetical protein